MLIPEGGGGKFPRASKYFYEPAYVYISKGVETRRERENETEFRFRWPSNFAAIVPSRFNAKFFRDTPLGIPLAKAKATLAQAFRWNVLGINLSRAPRIALSPSLHFPPRFHSLLCANKFWIPSACHVPQKGKRDRQEGWPNEPTSSTTSAGLEAAVSMPIPRDPRDSTTKRLKRVRDQAERTRVGVG